MVFPAVGGATAPPTRPARPRRRGRGRRMLLWAALALGLAGLAVSGVGVATQILPRAFTRAQQAQIVNWQMSRRWRDWPAGRIFPPTVGYRLPGSLFGGGAAVALTARLIGIAGESGCRAGLDAAAADVVARRGCVAVLRATYGDATGTLAVTVGVVVTPGPASARADARALPAGGALRPGVRMAPFRRTAAARFGEGQRQLSWREAVGPYLVLVAAGYADGRRRATSPADPYLRGEMLSLARGVGQEVAGSLGAAPPAPRCPGSPAC